MTDKVQPIRQQRHAARTETLIRRMACAWDLELVLDRPYVVKGWLDRGALSVVYGDANVGKSFWAIDLAGHVHKGFPWAGRKVKAGQVLYIAAEGGALFNNRLKAAQAGFMVLQGEPIRFGRNGDGKPLSEAVQHLMRVQGVEFALIIVDTLARVMGGADENTAPDIAGLLADLEHLRGTGAHVMLIHHSGKDVDRGARGHSSLRAAVDTEIQLTVDKDTKERVARITKQRDGESGLEGRFTLEQLTLGRDSDGDPVTTCIVRHKEGQSLI
jgi:RecA-family ATPase